MLPVPEWPGRTIQSWVVGITTAPRRQPTLRRCLTSLTLCGWDALHLFVDGDVQIPEEFASTDRTLRRPAAGAWRNFYLSITELLRRSPAADALMLVQDDALWPAHLPVREYLQQIAWPDDGRFIISPYCCADYTADSPGWHRFNDTWHYGAVVMIFSRESAEDFIADSVVIERCRNEWPAGIDDVIGEWAQRTGISVYVPTPSLVQHIGETSTLWSTARAVGLRRAARYLGDEHRIHRTQGIGPRPILCGWISADPPVVYHSMGTEDPGHYMPDEPITRFAMYLWHHPAAEIAELDRIARVLRPAHTLHHFVNDAATWRELTALGVSAHFINHNAFLDERLFVIQADVCKVYDAVYNGRMAPFKRHSLASAVPSLLVLGGTNSREDSDDYFQTLLSQLPQAKFSYAERKSYLSETEVNMLLNQSRVGLCLSAVEGTMYAATEYLLCGLPVVSTVSIGGRDTWFDPRFTRLVADDPEAVAAAVQELIALKIPPQIIRTETLCRMWDHRRRFLDLGQSIYAAHNSGRDFSRDFYAGFHSKLGDWCLPQDVMRRLRGLKDR